MEDHDSVGGSLESFMKEEGIFTEGNEQTETLRKSAEALGINPDLVAPKDEDTQTRYFARHNCKHCFGKGILTVCLSPQKRKVFWSNARKPTRVSFRQTKRARSRRIGPTRPALKQINGVSVENELGESWDTRRKEPANYKSENTAKSFCRCIRAVEV